MQQNIPNIPIYPNKGYAQQTQIQQQPNFSAGGPVSSGSSLIQNNPILKHAEKAKENNGGGYFANLLIAGAGMFGLNEFLNRNLQGDYDKTLLRKSEVWIDKFAAKPKVNSAIQYLSGKKQALMSKLGKSPLFKTITKKQSVGGSMVQGQAAGARGHLATRALDALKKYKAQTGTTQFDTIIAQAEKETHKHLKDIIKAINTSSADKSLIISKRPWWGLGIIKNKVNLQEILNKDMLLNNYKKFPTQKLVGGVMTKVKPTIGQRAVGTFARTAECVTNGLFAGKGAVLFQAFFIASALQEARKAEKGEKVGSFAGSLLEQMSYIGAIGLQMRIVNSLAGLKNLKMSATQFGKHQNLMKQISEAAKAGNPTAYEAACNNLKTFKTTLPKFKGMEKIANLIGKVFSFGRASEMIAPLKGNTLGKIKWGAKFGLGYALRGAFIFGVVMPVIASAAKNVGYAIFGKPKKTIAREKAKEEAEKKAAEEAKNPQAQQPPVTEPAKPVQPNMPNQPQPQQPQTQQTPSKPGNLVDKMNNMKNTPMGAQTMAPDKPIASSELKSPDAGIKRTYIPSPVLGPEAAVNPASSRSAQIDKIMRQADLAEAQAHKLGV